MRSVMRLHILSDLHVEFGPVRPSAVEADVVVLAGDVHTGENGFHWIQQNYPKVPVLYVLGNHEFYGENIPLLTRSIKELAKGSNVHVLENDRLELGDIVFLGATLWTDFRLYGDVVLAEAIAATSMMDFQRIRTTPYYHRFRPPDARRLHAESVTWLKRQIEEARGRKLVIVTHHAPSPRSISERYRGDPLNPAFASNLESIIESSGAALWVHGHIHQHADYMVGSTRVIGNPRGYPQEGYTGFDPALVIEV
jgi:Icc-related predicted phosphoesterase